MEQACHARRGNEVISEDADEKVLAGRAGIPHPAGDEPDLRTALGAVHRTSNPVSRTESLRQPRLVFIILIGPTMDHGTVDVASQ